MFNKTISSKQSKHISYYHIAFQPSNNLRSQNFPPTIPHHSTIPLFLHHQPIFSVSNRTSRLANLHLCRCHATGRHLGPTRFVLMYLKSLPQRIVPKSSIFDVVQEVGNESRSLKYVFHVSQLQIQVQFRNKYMLIPVDSILPAFLPGYRLRWSDLDI